MSDTTKIQWADKTFNPWEGCTKVSPGCAHCYAATRNHRFGMDNWGKGKARRKSSEPYWKQPLKWNRQAWICDLCDTFHTAHASCPGTKGHRPRVFPSLCDWLDEEVPIEWLADFLKLIIDTPNLDWLLLTKRPENWERRISQAAMSTPGNVAGYDEMIDAMGAWVALAHGVDIGRYPPNVWFGFSAENQECFDLRWAKAKDIPAAVTFCSFEPLLGPIIVPDDFLQRKVWPILGGESGPGARPCEINWIRDLLWQFQRAGVNSFVKQIGAHPILDPTDTVRYRRDKKGGNMDEWPEDLHVRQFPTPLIYSPTH